MPVVDPKSNDDQVLGKTIKKMLNEKILIAPLEINRLIDCIQMLPFSVTMQFDKIYGRWIVTNLSLDHILEHSTTTFNGPNFICIEHTLERAMARAIHYHYHNKQRD